MNIAQPFRPPTSKRLSDGGADLLTKIFTRPPNVRITTSEILNHSWIRDHTTLPDIDFGPEYRQAIKSWVHRKHFKTLLEKKVQSAGSVKSMLNDRFDKNQDTRPQITTMQYRELQKSFLEHQKIVGEDTSVLSNSSGIDYANFCHILRTNGLNQFAHEEIFSAFDMDGNGTISYFEFLFVLLSYHEASEGGDDLCKDLFMLFDEDWTETISREEFKDIISHILVDRLHEITPSELDFIFDTIDVSNSESITCDEFKAFYTSLSR